jgi:predicted enzyme related to lactoylglutathione lyase
MAIATVLLKVGSATQLLVTRDWYAKYLDLKVVHENAGRNAFLSDGPGARLALHIGEPAGDPAAVSIYIEVEDVDALYTRLSREGVPFDVTPSDRPMWGGRVAALRDPVGHVVKFFAPVERLPRDHMYPSAGVDPAADSGNDPILPDVE